MPAIPIGLAIGVLLPYRIASTRRTRAIVVLFAAVATAAVALLAMWITPMANAAWRDVIAGHPIWRGLHELRIDELGDPAYRLERHSRIALVGSVFVLAAFALSAAAVAGRRQWMRIAGGIAVAFYVFLYVPFHGLATAHALPAPLAAWSPNLQYVTMTIILVRVRPHTT